MRVKKVDLTPLDPKCLNFIHKKTEHKSGAYTSDGWMLPCCWLDDPLAWPDIDLFNMRDEELKVANNASLETIFKSDQWEEFFSILLYEPEFAPRMCHKKCKRKS